LGFFQAHPDIARKFCVLIRSILSFFVVFYMDIKADNFLLLVNYNLSRHLHMDGTMWRPPQISSDIS
jgi:hypothetical protein